MRTFGRYTLLEHIASGGMADVYRAEAPGAGGFRKEVAIKIVLPAFAAGVDAPAFLKMFMEEARLASRLSHANVVQVFDFDQVDGQHYIAMEFVRGRTLLQLLQTCQERNSPLDVVLAVYICAQVATALAYAHRLLDETGNPLGLVHRDVSPQNVMLSFEGEVKLADFGIAHARDSRTGTEPGMVKGKAAYMAPEQARGLPLDGRADVFALGVVLWEALTGIQPFQRSSDSATLLAVIGPEPVIRPPSTHNPAVPPELDAIVMHAMERDAEKRIPSAEQFATELSGLLVRTFSASGPGSDLRKLLVRLWPNETTPRPRSTMPRLVEPRASGTSDPGSGGGGSVPMTIVLDEAGRVPGSSKQPEDGDANRAPSLVRKYWPLLGAALVVVAAVLVLGVVQRGSPSGSTSHTVAPPSVEREPDLLPPPGPLSRQDEPSERPVDSGPPSAPSPPATSAPRASPPLPPVPPAAAAAITHQQPTLVPKKPHKTLSHVAGNTTGLATIEVTATPWAILYVDDRRIGYTPTTVTVMPGQHQLRAERDGYTSAETIYVVEGGDGRTWNPRLLPKSGQ
jgi:serine/threonine-protein kinase